MKFFLIPVLFLGFMLGSFLGFAQGQNPDSTTTEKKIYPYKLPIWGQQVVDRGYGDQMQLPLGISYHYVNAFIDMEITQFSMFINGDPTSPASKVLAELINPETLNFTAVNATTNGGNLRVDGWLFPFLNVYGLFSSVVGSTEVSLAPRWTDEYGNVIVQMDEFESKVSFNALAYGGGATFIYGRDNLFLSTDVNYSGTHTELLQDQVSYLTLSTRIGRRFPLSKKKKDMFVAGYVGAMFRDFVGADGNNGDINLDEVFPGADEQFNERVDTRRQDNLDEIARLDAERPDGWRLEIARLETQNLFLDELQTRINDSGLFRTEINYFIQKEMVQRWTFQFGFNFQINKHWALRGEYGVSASQRFLLTGLQYRFGI